MTELAIPPRKLLNFKYRIRCYFRDNPDEELTHASLLAKFGCSKWTAVWILKELKEEGVLESVHVIRLRVKGIAKEIS